MKNCLFRHREQYAALFCVGRSRLRIERIQPGEMQLLRKYGADKLKTVPFVNGQIQLRE